MREATLHNNNIRKIHFKDSIKDKRIESILH